MEKRVLGLSGIEINLLKKIFHRLFPEFLCLVFFLNVQSISAEGYRIQVKIDGIQDTKCYLGYYYGNSESIIDSAGVGENNYFLFQGDKPLPKGIYFVYSPSFFFEILVVDQTFSVETRSPNFVNTMKTHGSEENEVYNQLQRFTFQQQNLISSLTLSLAKVDSGKTLVVELKKIEEAARIFRKNLAKEHAGTFVSKVVQAMVEPKIPDNLDTRSQYIYLKEHFFDNIDFSEPALLRTPIVVPKYQEYLEQLTFQDPDSVIKSIDHLMHDLDEFPDFFRFTVTFLLEKYREANSRVFLHVAQNYVLNRDSSWMNEKQLKSVKEKVDYLTPKNRVGDLATDIPLVDPYFNKINLYSIPAEYTIIYFYDPDCNHCKVQTPILFDTYLKFRNKGIEVLAVCVTTDVQRWKEFIENDNWDWINGADPYFNSNFRSDYQVLTTPLLYVLDKNKEILASNLTVDDLEKFLKSLNF